MADGDAVAVNALRTAAGTRAPSQPGTQEYRRRLGAWHSRECGVAPAGEPSGGWGGVWVWRGGLGRSRGGDAHAPNATDKYARTASSFAQFASGSLGSDAPSSCEEQASAMTSTRFAVLLTSSGTVVSVAAPMGRSLEIRIAYVPQRASSKQLEFVYELLIAPQARQVSRVVSEIASVAETTLAKRSQRSRGAK